MDQPTDTKRTQLLIPVYALDTESLAFFKFATGIHDDNELKEHVLNVQAQAYTVCVPSRPFPYIYIYCMYLYRAFFPGGPLLPLHTLSLDFTRYACCHTGPEVDVSCTCKAWQDIQSARFKGVLNLDQEREGALFRILDVAVRTSLRHLHV